MTTALSVCKLTNHAQFSIGFTGVISVTGCGGRVPKPENPAPVEQVAGLTDKQIMDIESGTVFEDRAVERRRQDCRLRLRTFSERLDIEVAAMNGSDELGADCNRMALLATELSNAAGACPAASVKATSERFKKELRRCTAQEGFLRFRRSVIRGR